MEKIKKPMPHSPEPWRNPHLLREDVEYCDCGDILDENGACIATIPFHDERSKERYYKTQGALPKELATANARRIIACINACEGVPTELLEDLETMDNAFGDIKKTFCARAPISTRDDCTGDSIVNKDKKI